MTRHLALLLAACVPAAPTISAVAQQVVSAPSCYDPASYGAIPDDGVSDRIAAQQAIDAATIAGGGRVCFGSGRWTLDRAPVGSYNRFAALSTHGQHVTIGGVGDETVLDLAGDQGAQTTLLLSIDPGAEFVTVENLRLRSVDATNTDEQTHAIATSGVCSGAGCLPIRSVTIDRVTFEWPRNTASRKGDCIRLLGNTAPTATTSGTELYGVKVTNVRGDCARSFVEIQRGVHDLVIAGNTITCATCDQDIDGEATGVVGEVGRPSNVAIVGNTFTDGPGTSGDFSIALTYVKGATVTGNILPRGIGLFGSTGVAIVGNTINSLNHTGDDGTIDVKKSCDGLVVSSNQLARGGYIGPVVKLLSSSGVVCRGFAVSGNTITQGTAFHAIYGEAVRDGAIRGNVITYGVTASAYSAVTVRSVYGDTPRIVRGLSIAGNLVTGDVGPTYGVTLDCSPGLCGLGISVSDNTSVGNTLFGLHVNHAENAQAITSGVNAMGAEAYGGAVVQPGN